jgi:hypothetical protein
MAGSGAGASCGCGCSHSEGAQPAEAAASPEPASVPQPVDFVCEADVRDAIRDKRKIHITPKTIVTPSARDLAAPSDILVLTRS